MSKVKIYVEGVQDRIFIADFLEEVLGTSISTIGSNKNIVYSFSRNNVEGEILILGGWGKLNTDSVQNELRDNTNDNIKNIILLDADTTQNDGSYAIRQGQVEDLRRNQSLSFEYFLIPNDSANGCLETVLRAILVPDNQAILDCIDASDDCLRSAQESISRELNLFPLKGAEKHKLSSFRTILGDAKDFKDNTIWDLNHSYLTPLKEFLEQHLV